MEVNEFDLGPEGKNQISIFIDHSAVKYLDFVDIPYE